MNPAFAEPYDTVALIVFAFVGLCIGSFLNVVHSSPAAGDVGRDSPFAMQRVRLRAAVVRQRPGAELGAVAGTLPQVRVADQHPLSHRRDPDDGGVPAALVGVRLDAC